MPKLFIQTSEKVLAVNHLGSPVRENCTPGSERGAGHKYVKACEARAPTTHNVNHTRLLKKLWHMGIRDRRVLMIIKAMLKAGIMGELEENPLGTPQEGIISPILANAYLDALDQWVTREWENKKTKTRYMQHGDMLTGLRKRSNLKPAYLVRYADDWTLTTSSRSNAVKWKRRIAKYLDAKLKLTLSEEKTIITDIRKKPIVRP